MQSAQNSLCAHGLIILHKRNVDSRFLHIAQGVSLHEISAAVSVNGRRDDAQPFDPADIFLNCDLHTRSPSDIFRAHPSNREEA